jgi:hypothetical protein
LSPRLDQGTVMRIEHVATVGLAALIGLLTKN